MKSEKLPEKAEESLRERVKESPLAKILHVYTDKSGNLARLEQES